MTPETILNRIPHPPGAEKALRTALILVNDMGRCDLFKHASAMAYVTLLSLIPSLAATFGLLSLFSPLLGEENSLIIEAKQFILSNLAPGSGEQIIGHIETFLGNLDMKKIGLTGFGGLLFTLVLLLRQIEIALNRIWLVTKPRNIVTRFVNFWTFITLGTVFVGLSIGFLSGFDLNSLNPFGDAAPIEESKSLFRFIVPLVAPVAFFTLLYKIVPNTFVSTKDALFGAVPAAILFAVASAFYGWFTGNFTNYKAIYGALAAIPVFLFWLYVLWLITLFGALLSWRFQQSFELEDSMDEQSLNLSAEEKFRNHQLQTMTPYLCLLAIYDRFLSGDGRGVSGNEISQKLCIPSPWVGDALDTLIHMGFAVPKSEDEHQAADYLQANFFPTLPAEKISVGELRTKLSEASSEWIHNWHHEWSTDLKPALEKLWVSQKEQNFKLSIAELLN